jgi:5-hydroxyisourate hydrolase
VSAISTHILDLALGTPAAGVPVRLDLLAGSAATEIGRARTDGDGRVASLQPAGVGTGTYRLVFDTAAYFRARHPQTEPFFPEVSITFSVLDQARGYHVPLLLSPYGYSTYRGS